MHDYAALVGTQQHDWTILALIPGRVQRYRCRCVCKTEHTVVAETVRTGRSRRCRACGYKVTASKIMTHGDTVNYAMTAEYRIWHGMLERCGSPKHQSYADYGGRGLRVCPEWEASFEAFLADVGRRPSPAHSLDRFPNGAGNYEPGNVRWATSGEQSRNRKTTRWLTLNGVTLCGQDWGERLGIPPATIYDRLRRRLPVEQVLGPKATPPIRACSAPGCPDRARSLGLCSRHYLQQYHRNRKGRAA